MVLIVFLNLLQLLQQWIVYTIDSALHLYLIN